MLPPDLQSSPVRKRGGRRPGAGRPKLRTPIKKAVHKHRIQQQRISRARVQSKFAKIELKLSNLSARGLKGTDEYRALALEYIRLSKWLNKKTANYLHDCVQPRLDEGEPSTSSEPQSGIRDAQSSASSDEVLM